MDVLITRALLFGVNIRAPDFLATPRWSLYNPLGSPYRDFQDLLFEVLQAWVQASMEDAHPIHAWVGAVATSG